MGLSVGLLEPLIQFAVVTGLAYSYAIQNKQSLARRQTDPWTSRWPVTRVVCCLVVFPILGGLLNRIRGGWRPLGLIQGDTLARLLISSGVALYARWVGGVSPQLVSMTILLTFLGLLVGWGCYFSMGRPLDSPVPLPEGSHTDCIDEPDRFGCFDLILGVPELEWTAFRRWRRDIAGMSLRGYIWMLPVGVGFAVAGFGNLVLTAGVLMGLIYELGYDTPSTLPNFGQGSAVAEFYMGYFWFLVVAAAVLGRRQDEGTDGGAGSGAADVDDTDRATKEAAKSSGAPLSESLLPHQHAAVVVTSSEVGQGSPQDLAQRTDLAKAIARGTYATLLVITAAWTVFAFGMTVYCAMENHPLPRPDDDNAGDDTGSPDSSSGRGWGS